MANNVSSSLATSLLRERLTVFRVGSKFRLALARVRIPAPSRLLMALLAGCGVQAFANPTGGQVVSGNITINAPQNGSLNVVQTTNKGVIDWQTFNVGSGEKVNFLQPGATSSTLNRVVGNDASTIFGQINANGQVFLLNQNGILFAPGSQVNVGGLIASTLQLSDADYLAGRYTLTGGTGAGSIGNQGVIKAGFAVLAAPQVDNLGIIIADGGTAALAAGDRVTLDLLGSDVVSVSVDAPTAAALVHSGGILQADGGKVLITAKAAGALLDTVVNVDGLVQARSIGTRNGTIVLDGGSSGVVNVAGRLDASGAAAAGQTGGTVKMLGEYVGLYGTGSVDVSGDAGGGVVRIGGDWHGAGGDGDSNATQVYAGAGTSIDADAITRGNGGNIVLWSNDQTRIAGAISARGGALSGDGGAIETSSHKILQADAAVSAGAAHGKGGSWLLDPDDITISTGSTSGGYIETGTPTDKFWSTATTATLNNTTLSNSLASGTNVTVLTSSGSSTAGTITVSAAITTPNIASGTGVLNLDAQSDIVFTSGGSIAVSNAGTGLTVNLNAGTTASGTNPGTNASTISMAAGSFINTGTGDFSATAKGAVVLGALTVGGNATISAAGDVTQLGAMVIQGLASVTTSAGNITLTDAGNDLAAFGATDTDAAGGASHGNVTLTTVGPVILTDVNGGTGVALDGNLTINAGGSLTQSSGTSLLVGGTTSATTSAGNISLTNAGNNLDVFTATDTDGAGGAAHGNVSVTTTGALVLGGVNGGTGLALDGDLAINVGGTLTQSTGASLRFGGATSAGTSLLVGGAMSVTTSGGNITLDNAGNSIAAFAATDTGAGHGNVSLTTTGALALGGVNGGAGTPLGGDLAIHAGGTVSQAGGTALLVGGSTTIATTAGNVTLTNSGNNLHAFGATDTDATFGNGNVAFVTSGSTVLNDVNGGAGVGLAGGLAVTAGGNVTQASATHLLVLGETAVSTTAGNIAVGSTGSNLGTFRATDTDVSVGMGNVTVTTGGALVLGNVVATALTVDTFGAVSQVGGATLQVSGATTVNAGAGDIVLDGNNTMTSFGGSTMGNVTVNNAQALALNDLSVGDSVALTGTATITTTAGDLFQGSTFGVTVQGPTVLDAQAGSVLLTSTHNDFVGGVSATGHSIGLTDANDLNVTALTLVAPSGNVALKAVTGALSLNMASTDFNLGTGDLLLSSGGAGGITTGVLTAHDITLESVGGVTIAHNLTATHDLTITNDNTASPITQSAGTIVSVGGATTVTAGSGAVRLVGDGNNVFTGQVLASGGAIDVRALSGLDANVTATSTVTLDAGTGALRFQASTGGDLTANGSSVVIGATAIPGTLSVTTTGGAITQTGALTVDGATVLNANGGNIALTTATNDFAGEVTASGAAIGLTDKNALVVHGTATGDANYLATGALAVDGSTAGTLTVHGAGVAFGSTAANTTTATTLVANSTGGITQLGQLVVSGTTALTAAPTGAITLDFASNDFGGAATASGGAVSLSDVNSLAVHLGGATSATLVAAGSLAVDGSTSGALRASGAGVSFGTTNVGGTLGVNATGAVGQTGGLVVAGATTIAAGANSVTLNDPLLGNALAGGVTVTGGALDIEQGGALAVHLGGVGSAVLKSAAGVSVDGQSTGDLSLTAGGAVTQAADLSVGGNTTLAAGANDITLSRGGNAFGGNVAVKGGHVTLVAGGALTVTGSSAADMALTGSSVNFGDAGTTVGGSLSVGTGVPLAVAQSAGAKPLAAVAGGIAQSGALRVGGTSTLDAGGGDIALTNAGNTLTGEVTAIGHNVAITTNGALNATVTGSGDSTLTATGGDLVVGGAIAGGLTATGGSVTVGEAGPMTFAGAVNATSTTGDITFGAVQANGVNATAAGTVFLDGTLVSTDAVVLSGASIQGANSRGALDVSAGRNITLIATNGNIGRSATPVMVPGRPDPVSVITLSPQTGQAGSSLTLHFEAGHTAWFSVASKQQFAAIQFVEPASLNSATFGCTATTCFNVLGQTTSIADSMIANILSAASQDAADAAFGTENLDFAIRKGYVTTIGRVPPGIDEIAGDLGATQCDSRVTSSTSISADKACTGK